MRYVEINCRYALKLNIPADVQRAFLRVLILAEAESLLITCSVGDNKINSSGDRSHLLSQTMAS